MSEREAAISCPKCGAATVRRSRRANAGEMMRMMLGVYPFRCTTCGERFWSSVWLFNSWRWAKCPRCLNLNLTNWPERHYRISTWTQFLTAIGAKKHRCTRCRNNFVSFKSRLPQYQDLDAEEDGDVNPNRAPDDDQNFVQKPSSAEPKPDTTHTST